MEKESNSLDATNSSSIPWLYSMKVDDTNWIITSSFMIFTMQTGFGMLESGCVSIKNEVNIMMKNVVDIALGGLTYWMFGYAFSFGRSPFSNGFISIGDFFIDPTQDDPLMGAIYSAFIFQLSFATTATTIVSGAMAERCNFKAYCIFSFWNTLIYCIPAGWVWGEKGFLKAMGAVDIAGSGPVHLIGGSAALGAAIMLGPRLGRYDNGILPLPLGNPVNAVMGLFVLWWGWLAFNSGSTYGLSGEKWQYAARAAVMTMMATFGGGTVSILYSLILEGGRIEILAIINGVLGALVSITAGCFLYEAWESLVIGSVGALLACIAMPLFDKMGIDDPVGASSVHGVCGIWGVLAVGIFASNVPIGTTNGLQGVIHGGGFYLLGIQALTCVCLAAWGTFSCMILLYLINKVVLIRMDVHHELLGADLTEHHIKHSKVGVSRALSALRSVVETGDVEKIFDVGSNPGHDVNVLALKNMNNNSKRYKFSRIFRDFTRDRNFGIAKARQLFPSKKELRKKSSHKTKKMSIGSRHNQKTRQVTPISTILGPLDKLPPPMAWID